MREMLDAPAILFPKGAGPSSSMNYDFCTRPAEEGPLD